LGFSAKVGRKTEKGKKKEDVCRRDLGFLKDRSIVNMKKLLNELTVEDGSGHTNFLRMDPATFREQVSK